MPLFPGLLDNVFNRDIIEKIVTKKATNYSIVYIPRYGYCKEISNYTSKKLKIEIRTPNLERMRIFITDRNFRSYFNPDYTSQRGIPIIVEENDLQAKKTIIYASKMQNKLLLSQLFNGKSWFS